MNQTIAAAANLQALHIAAEADRLRFVLSPRCLDRRAAKALSGATGRPPSAVRYSRSKYDPRGLQGLTVPPRRRRT